MMTQDVISFMVRFIREADGADGVRWRGLIQHVQGNKEQRFSQFAEAMAFIQEQVNESVRASFGDEDDEAERPSPNPFLEATKMWGDWLPQYNRKVMEQMTAVLDSSANLPQQMEKNMAAWLSLWGLSEDDAATQKIATLEAQVAALQAEVAALKTKQQ